MSNFARGLQRSSNRFLRCFSINAKLYAFILLCHLQLNPNLVRPMAIYSGTQKESAHNLAVDFFAFSASFTRSQQTSAQGATSWPTSYALGLLACLTAYLAPIPWKMMQSLYMLNAAPHGKSDVRFQPATSAYHLIHSSRVGRPASKFVGLKACLALRRASISDLGIWDVNVYGTRRLERSESG